MQVKILPALEIYFNCKDSFCADPFRNINQVVQLLVVVARIVNFFARLHFKQMWNPVFDCNYIADGSLAFARACYAVAKMAFFCELFKKFPLATASFGISHKIYTFLTHI